MGYKFEKYSIGGGAFQAIIDVDALPTENINESVFYRRAESAYSVFNGEKNTLFGAPVSFVIVDALPSVGEPTTDDVGSPTYWKFYYDKTTAQYYAYVTTDLIGFDDWVTASEVMGNFGLSAVVAEEGDATNEADTLYLFSSPPGIFVYNGEAWEQYVTDKELEKNTVEISLSAFSSTDTRHAIIRYLNMMPKSVTLKVPFSEGRIRKFSCWYSSWENTEQSNDGTNMTEFIAFSPVPKIVQYIDEFYDSSNQTLQTMNIGQASDGETTYALTDAQFKSGTLVFKF